MRAGLLWLLAVPLAGCFLGPPDDLQFVTTEFVTEGRLFLELEMGPALIDQGYSDCGVTFDLVGDAAEPIDGCPDCAVVFVVDRVLREHTCAQIPDPFGDDAVNESIGVQQGQSWIHDGGWVEFVPGELDGLEFGGATDPLDDVADLTYRRHLNLIWIEP